MLIQIVSVFKYKVITTTGHCQLDTEYWRPKMRYFIRFSYNGTKYHGWQTQPNAISVQETLTKVLSVILNAHIELMGAGRTDTGVHAREMFAHFDYEPTFDKAVLLYKANSLLPKDIAIYDFINVHTDAHARFDAKKRTYEYYINTIKDPFLQDGSWYYHNTLDVDLMNKAAKLLFAHTDFQCFSKSNTDVNTYNCKIAEAYWEQKGHLLVFTISADRFLRNMVRAIVGTLINIGLNKITLQDFEAILQSKDRKKAGFSVPAHGLYLTQIKYDFLDNIISR